VTTLFISDLHLDTVRPDITALFLKFLDTEARRTDRLYILGDFFEVWIGDDDPDPHHAEVMRALRRLTDAGVPVDFMRGNRDFIIGADFATRTGVRLLEDPTVVDLYGQATLLMHGDTVHRRRGIPGHAPHVPRSALAAGDVGETP
jgi:UDP-2,3-diacylglucosamine hydrolase